MHLICFNLHAIKAECMLQVSGNKLQAAPGEVQVSSGDIHEWRKAEQGDWYTEWYW